MKPGRVKKSRYFLSGDNRGASLIAVIVALVFVTTFGVVIMEMTTTNSRMSEIELFEKENFYSADEVMDVLKSSMLNYAAKRVQEAYKDIVYYDKESFEIIVLNRDFQKLFAEKYIIGLENELSRGWVGLSGTSGTSLDYPLNCDAWHKVIKDNIRNNIGDKLYQYLDLSNLYYVIDFEAGTFALKNLTVRFTTKDGYETVITTDLVFNTPEVQFDGSFTNSFTNYSLVANEGIKVTGGSIKVGGNVYAGNGGIEASLGNASATFTGDTIVTTGDIVVMSNTRLVFGKNNYKDQIHTHIWAENIRTEGFEGTGPVLEMYGEINIADDLELNGRKSEVTLAGHYNGYNFRETYDAGAELKPTTDASFSSAVMINGRECSLDLSNLSQLFLAGRTFIRRGTQGDIWLGESLSVRSDQIAYYVSNIYLDKDESGIVKEEIDEDGRNVYARFSEDGLKAYSAATGVDKLDDYLVDGNRVIAYGYRDGSGAEYTRYYLNFKDEASANRFFSAYWESSVGSDIDLSAYGTDYAASIKLDPTLQLLTLGGDLLYRNGNAPLSLVDGAQNTAEWHDPESVYWQMADRLARTYKSLAEDLSGDYARVESANVRFEGTENPMFGNLIDEGRLESLLKSGAYGGSKVVITNGDYVTGKDGFTEGIVVAEGDVTVENYFRGIVIAKGDVIFRNASSFEGIIISEGTISLDVVGLEVEQNAALVEKLLTEHPEIAQIFTSYQQLSDLRIGDYVTYENWTKNEE